MNITLQVILTPATHDLSYNPAKAARRYRRGDIVGVLLSSEVTEPPNPNTRLVFVHITGAPDRPIQTIRNKLTNNIRSRIPYSDVVPVFIWDEMEAAGGYSPFLDIPTVSMSPDIDVTMVVRPADLIETQAKFATITSTTQDPQTFAYTIVGTVNTWLLTGEIYQKDRRREWRIPPGIVPTGLRNQLINDREIAITWTQAKPYIRKKIISNRLDPSTDDESTELVDI